MSYHIGIILADFNKEITDNLLEAASNRIIELKSKLVKTVRVPGSYEIPIVAQNLFEKKVVDGLICLAYIEKGHTLHGEVMGNVVQAQLIRLQEKFKKPIGFGIIGPGATLEQAIPRAIPYGIAAADACIRMLNVMKELDS